MYLLFTEQETISERVSDLPEVTQLVAAETRIRAQFVSFKSLLRTAALHTNGRKRMVWTTDTGKPGLAGVSVLQHKREGTLKKKGWEKTQEHLQC